MQPHMSSQDASPASWRKDAQPWRIEVMLGPNMRHLGKRDKRLFGAIESDDELQQLVTDFGRTLGVVVQTFVSDFEGELLEHVYRTAAAVDAYIVDPGGLATISQGWPHALIETRKPVVEVCFYNMLANNEVSMFGGTSLAPDSCAVMAPGAVIVGSSGRLCGTGVDCVLCADAALPSAPAITTSAALTPAH